MEPNTFYLKGLADDEERYELSEARMWHIYMIISFAKEGNKSRAIEFAGSESQFNQVIISEFYKEYFRLKEAFEIHKNSNNHWMKWGHRCYSDFEQYGQEKLPIFNTIIDKITTSDFIDLAVQMI